MTISTTTIKNSYSGNGVLTVFAYTFKIATTADIEVIIRSSTGSETVKDLTTHYSVSGAGSASGGNVTMGTPPATGETLVIRRATTQTQAVDLVENDPFTADSVEGAFDKNLSIAQELQEELDRSIKVSRTTTIASSEITASAVDRASKLLSFDSSGNLAVDQELGSFRGNWATATVYAARDLVKDTSNNNIYLANTGHTSSGSQPISSNTDVAKWDLIVDAAAASTSATAAASSATAAASSATAAASSATSAASSATTATTQASTATTQAGIATAKAVLTAADAVSTAADVVSAAALLDTFDDKFLGSKSSNPTLDNDGNALTDGAIFYHTGDNRMKVYDLGTTTWFYVSPSSSEQTNINLVGGSIANVNEVAGNLGTINEFGERYRIASAAPSSSLDVGDLYFDTTANELKVYKSSGWAAAGSTVNGTAQRYNYTATAAQTTFTGADTNGNTLAYDAGYADVYLNGVRLSGADITITSGTSVVLAAGASAGDILDIVAYGTFNVAAVAGSAITSGTINAARMPKSVAAVWESKSNDFTAAAGKAYFCDTSSNDIDVTLPSPTIGDTIRFLDVSATFDTNDLTILYGSSKIQGASANLDVTTERAGFELVYYNSTQGWLLKDV